MTPPYIGGTVNNNLSEETKENETGQLPSSCPGVVRGYYTVGWLAASMILMNFSGTREAPPIRPPSMSGWASSS